MATIKYRENASAPWEIVKALPSIGQAVEITATEITGKSIADRAAMYAAGTRLLKVVNGDTEVLLGLDADGSTEWLGSNKPLNNLLDNSDFAHPVAQAGQNAMHGVHKYVCDRWVTWDGQDATFSNGAITLDSLIDQNVDISIFDTSKRYTIAIGLADGTISTNTGLLSDNIGTYVSACFFGKHIDRWFARIGGGQTVKWAALYEGSYTADTLPPYTPKGYAAELAECQRYFRIIGSSNSVYEVIMNGVVTDGGKVLNVNAFNEAMRVQPTVAVSGSGGLLVRGSSGYMSGISYDSPYTGANIGASQWKNSICLIISKSDASSWGGTNNSNISIALKPPYTIALSADL